MLAGSLKNVDLIIGFKLWLIGISCFEPIQNSCTTIVHWWTIYQFIQQNSFIAHSMWIACIMWVGKLLVSLLTGTVKLKMSRFSAFS